jgi:hypothetical protein
MTGSAETKYYGNLVELIHIYTTAHCTYLKQLRLSGNKQRSSLIFLYTEWEMWLNVKV